MVYAEANCVSMGQVSPIPKCHSFKSYELAGAICRSNSKNINRNGQRATNMKSIKTYFVRLNFVEMLNRFIARANRIEVK